LSTNPSLSPLNPGFALPADDIYQWCPLGEYPVFDELTKRVVVQVVDQQAVELMAADLRQRATDPAWGGVLIDYDHDSDDQERSSKAGGWGLESQSRPDGMWGKIRWSASGKADVEGGNFRYLSPVFEGATAQPLGGNRYRVTQILSLALTNKPNLRGILPLSNRISGSAVQPQTQTTKTMKNLMKLLGLAEDASEESAVAAVQALIDRSAKAETKVTDTNTELGALKNRADKLQAAAVERTLEEHKDSFADEQAKSHWKNRLMADYDGTLQLLQGFRRSTPPAKHEPMHKGGKPPAAPETSGAGLGRLRNRATELDKAAKPEGFSALEVAAESDPEAYAAYLEEMRAGKRRS
jgi:phage I-like protein